MDQRVKSVDVESKDEDEKVDRGLSAVVGAFLGAGGAMFLAGLIIEGSPPLPFIVAAFVGAAIGGVVGWLIRHLWLLGMMGGGDS